MHPLPITVWPWCWKRMCNNKHHLGTFLCFLNKKHCLVFSLGLYAQPLSISTAVFSFTELWFDNSFYSMIGVGSKKFVIYLSAAVSFLPYNSKPSIGAIGLCVPSVGSHSPASTDWIMYYCECRGRLNNQHMDHIATQSWLLVNSPCTYNNKWSVNAGWPVWANSSFHSITWSIGEVIL